VSFDAPTYRPLAFAVLVTQDPDTGEFHVHSRTGAGYQPPDPSLIAYLRQSVEIANLAEQDPHP